MQIIAANWLYLLTLSELLIYDCINLPVPKIYSKVQHTVFSFVICQYLFLNQVLSYFFLILRNLKEIRRCCCDNYTLCTGLIFLCKNYKGVANSWSYA